MNRFIFQLLLLLPLSIYTNAQADYKIPNNIKKILFLGNSITYGGHYVAYIEAFLTIQHPERAYEFINVGLPSETVSGLSEPNHARGKFPRPDLHERLERILTQVKPDLVFACYGMNDGIYLPLDEARFQKYKDGIVWLHDEVTKRGTPIVHITDAVYDEKKGPAYANVLDLYSDWLISLRYTAKWNVVNTHWPMKKALEDKRLTDSTFIFAKDGIHPNEIGHWVIAKNILAYLGETKTTNFDDAKSAFASMPSGVQILELVVKRQTMMKDTWLTATGHKRPEMKIGLALDEANIKATEIEVQIRRLLK
jgi:lysophospholipase L1-like esterase